MARTSLAYVETILDDDWLTDVSGRSQSVPKPQIALEADEDTTRLSLSDGDICFVRDGGAQSITPKSFGYENKGIETLVTIDLRTKHSRGRLEGVRDSNNDAEDYGGLRGEVERILELRRKGDKEFDLVNGYEWNDLSGDTGYRNWRGTWEVQLDQIGPSVNPPTS